MLVTLFSLIVLTNTRDSGLTWANLAPEEQWYPAGPSTDTAVFKRYVDPNAEMTGLSAFEIDLADAQLSPGHVSTFNPDPNFYVSSPKSPNAYEIEFNLANHFWGCNFDYGNAPCGREIRQGISHLIDKVKFTAIQADIAGLSLPLDNPVLPTLGLPEPNPCAWDVTHPQFGSNCVVGEGGTTGGVAYHLFAATGAGTPFPWQPSLGSPDFCAAADHFIAANVATAKNLDCTLTGHTVPAVTSNPVTLIARSDNHPLLQLGQSIAGEICAVFTGSFPSPIGCPGLTYVTRTINTFEGFNFLNYPTQVNRDWWIYTAGVGSQLFPNPMGGNPSQRPALSADPFDTVLYFAFNSRFISGAPSVDKPPCSTNAPAVYAPTNYYYLCDPQYDTISNQMEYAPCLSASGDPTNGQATPTFANCPQTSQPTAVSAGYQAEDRFGQNAYTIPVWASKSQFAYRSNWQRVINSVGGTTNYFTLLNARSSPQSSTVRQGLSTSTISVNPYAAITFGDFLILGGIYDSPNAANPWSDSSTLDWLTISTQVLSNAQLSYTPAPGTVQTYRYTFRNDIFWQTGQKMTAWDAAFSYVSTVATGSFPYGGTTITGIKVLSRTQLDVGINASGPFTQLYLSGVPIVPARLWLDTRFCTQTDWDAGASNPNFAAANAALTPCIVDRAFVTASGVILPTAGQSHIDQTKITANYDPVGSGTLVGSGPWVCKSSGGIIGLGCSSTGTEYVDPGGTFTLQRNGLGTTPGGSLNSYFRSSGNLALYIWTGDTGNFNQDFLNFGVVSLCFGQALLPLGTTTGCGHWQQGIGAPGGHSTVGLTQVGIVQRFVGVNWVSPYDWVTSPPSGIASFPPVLYDGISTGNAGNPFPAGATQLLNPATVAGCASAYPSGGYDC